MPVIRVLDKQMAELIAAGEVIERPASVVKELVENSIDAGASSVTVEIQGGGVRFIRITDNGCGIAREDVPTAFLRHATSKVRQPEDLYQIGTLGFRGEALPSIAAVSRVEVLTKTSDEQLGTRFAVSGGENQCCEDAGCPVGTTIFVKDLFYNIPARMKFLKKDQTEGNAVAALLERLCLSHPEISFTFLREGQKKLHTPGDGKLLSAVYAVYGREFAKGLIPVSLRMNGLMLEGYITKPECGRASRAMEHFFINGRYVKSVTMLAALEDSYKNSMMVGKFPGCVLNLTVPCGMVDVNVHPAKMEVKISNDRSVYEIVMAASKGALAALNPITMAHDTVGKSLKQKLNLIEVVNKPQNGTQLTLQEQIPPKKKESDESVPDVLSARKQPMLAASPPFQLSKPEPSPPIVIHRADPQIFMPAKTKSMESRQSLSERYGKEFNKTEKKQQQKEDHTVSFPVEKETDATDHLLQKQETTAPVEKSDDEMVLLGEAFGTYLLAQTEKEFILIDKHAAHERILFNKLKTQHENGEIPNQLLLVSQKIQLSKNQHDILLENIEQIEKCGFEFDDFGDGALLVRAIPAVLPISEIESTLSELSDCLLSGRTQPREDWYDELYHSIACKSAVKGNSITGEVEQKELIRLLNADRTIRNCPHGRPVLIALTKRELERMFGRIQ